MNFNSLEFLVLFLPLTFVLFHRAPVRWRLPVLAAASIVFYGVSGLWVLAAFLVAIAWAYAITAVGQDWPKSWLIAAAVSVPAFFLIMFKYLNFILDTFNAGPDARSFFWIFLSIVLPAGISFYTFELASYAVDVADKKIERDRSFTRFLAFATFFPHLIAGPIMRYADLRDQLMLLEKQPILRPQIQSGLKLLAIGLFCKIFLADVSGLAIARAKAVPLEQLTAIDQVTEIAFWSMQIYYDFWAYSVMAIGLGRLFCIELPVNFREPYQSRNPREFWQRWHVTLSYWLRDYVYIRLGGRENYVRNTLVVFALVGLWHGAGWNFVAWGVYHGLLVILYRVTAPAWNRLPAPVAVALTFALVSLGWPLFFLSLNDYGQFLKHLATAPWHGSVYQATHWIFLAALGVATFGFREQDWLYNGPDSRNLIMDSPIVAAILMFAGLLFISLSTTFIYFRF